ncbi:endochitinase, partial [Quercus suber]
GGDGGDAGSLISANHPRCKSNGFYTYNAFIAAARSFNGFGTLVMLLHEGASAPDGHMHGDIVLLRKITSKLLYLNILAINHNYGQADLVATDPTISFKTAIWFWMTPQANKPSSHDVITGNWRPSSSDTSAGRVPGYGVITNIINGGIECGRDIMIMWLIGLVSIRGTLTYWE